MYRGNYKAERDLLTYANFVMMFPQLVAGPIERANNLLPQLRTCDHEITYQDFSIGFTRFIWGLFKKVVVADTLSVYVDTAYNSHIVQPGVVLLTATFFFAIQIYCDFSGYSDMAIGIARVLGFKFKENFTIPYFSKDITEFWRRWHMSLSSWLRDYLYISFGGNRKGKLFTYRNLMLTMLIGGFWHGASWNFVIWGGLNGLFLSFEKLTDFNKLPHNNFILKLLRVTYVFLLISFTWVFFRATTFAQATEIINSIIFNFGAGKFNFFNTSVFATIVIGVTILFTFEYFIFRKNDFNALYLKKNGDLFFTVFGAIFLFIIILFGNSEGGQFIYFQF